MSITSHSTRTHDSEPTTRNRGRFGSAPTILVTSVIGFAIVVVTTIVAMTASGVDLLSDASSTQLAEISGLLAFRNTVFLFAFVWGGLGVALVARRVLTDAVPGRLPAIGALLCCALSILAGVAQIVFPLIALGFDQERFGETAGYTGFWLATAVTVWAAVGAVGLVALTVRATGSRRIAMIVIAVACLLYVLVDITTRGGVPPFGIAFLWLALGVTLRASRVPA